MSTFQECCSEAKRVEDSGRLLANEQPKDVALRESRPLAEERLTERNDTCSRRVATSESIFSNSACENCRRGGGGGSDPFLTWWFKELEFITLYHV